jgi:hypothetical protein
VSTLNCPAADPKDDERQMKDGVQRIKNSKLIIKNYFI